MGKGGKRRVQRLPARRALQTVYGAFGTVVWESISAAYGGFVSANSRPSAARTVALSVPTRGLRPLEWWFCQCQAWVLPTFLRYRNLADRCAVCWSFVGPRGAPRRSDPQTTNTLHTYLPSS
ncbi:hypothetical protein Ddc_19224 [Ditylenchus destructor]|nr:hypothetical protein Ddc_19224 [Ditylenchus destructor]